MLPYIELAMITLMRGRTYTYPYFAINFANAANGVTAGWEIFVWKLFSPYSLGKQPDF